jgi:hypothetical protein
MLPYLFVLLAIAVRFLPFAGLNFLPHAWHFTPIGASLLFFGARGSRRQMWIPFVLLVVTDVVLTKFVYAYMLTWDQLFTWAWYAAMLWLGAALLGKSAGPVRVIGAALTCSVSFFLISNFAVWAAWPDMYPHTASGLMMAYAAGIPFFRGTAESDLFFSIAFFGTPVFLHALSGWMRRSTGDHIAAA